MTASKDNASGLNIRLAVSQSVTKKQGDDYAKTIATVESDLPPGIDALEGLRQIRGTLDAFFTTKQSLQQPKAEAAKPTPLDPTELERLEWRPYKEGHRAAWIFTDKTPKPLTDQLEKGPVTLGEFTYKFSGPAENPKMFVSRAPVKE